MGKKKKRALTPLEEEKERKRVDAETRTKARAEAKQMKAAAAQEHHAANEARIKAATAKIDNENDYNLPASTIRRIAFEDPAHKARIQGAGSKITNGGPLVSEEFSVRPPRKRGVHGLVRR